MAALHPALLATLGREIAISVSTRMDFSLCWCKKAGQSYTE